MAAKGNKTVSFEARLEKLEKLAEKMEQGAAPLEELMRDYEEGMQLAQSLEGELEKVRARMMEVKAGAGGALEKKASRVAVQATLLDDLEMEE